MLRQNSFPLSPHIYFSRSGELPLLAFSLLAFCHSLLFCLREFGVFSFFLLSLYYKIKKIRGKVLFFK